MASTSDNVVIDNTVVVEKKTKKGKTPKVEVPVAQATSSVELKKDEQVNTLVQQLSDLVKRMELLENEVKELKQQSAGSSQTKQTTIKKEEKEKKTRAPTAYNNFMKEKMLELKETHPNLTNIERMKMAAEAWTESKKS